MIHYGFCRSKQLHCFSANQSKGIAFGVHLCCYLADAKMLTTALNFLRSKNGWIHMITCFLQTASRYVELLRRIQLLLHKIECSFAPLLCQMLRLGCKMQ